MMIYKKCNRTVYDPIFNLMLIEMLYPTFKDGDKEYLKPFTNLILK